jgi:Ca-activated chloride channel homolog
MWHLGNSQALWLLLLPLLLGAFFLLRRRRPQERRQLFFSGPEALVRRESQKIRRSFRLMFLATVVGLVALAFAAARPFEVNSSIKRTGEGIDILIVLDVSESMDADDLEPSRIDSAKSVIRDFIHRRSNDRIGIVVFSGDAVTKCPLTRDYDFLLSQVEDIRLREMKQGTAIGMGLASGVARLRKSESKSKVILLLTDGDSNVGAINPITATQLAKQEGIKIYTIGMGKANRVVVPIYAYDMFGHKTQLVAQVPSYLNPELLQEISRLTGGKSFMARDSKALSKILQEIDQLEKTKIKITRIEQRKEKFILPALVALGFLFLVVCLQETRFRKARHAVSV